MAKDKNYYIGKRDELIKKFKEKIHPRMLQALNEWYEDRVDLDMQLTQITQNIKEAEEEEKKNKKVEEEKKK